VEEPPWYELVEPNPGVPRERPDHPAPPWSNRDDEGNQHEPNCRLATGSLQETIPSYAEIALLAATYDPIKQDGDLYKR